MYWSIPCIVAVAKSEKSSKISTEESLCICGVSTACVKYLIPRACFRGMSCDISTLSDPPAPDPYELRSRHPLMMEQPLARQVMEKLPKFQLGCVAPNAPMNATFTALRSTLRLGDPHAAIAMKYVFNISEELLTGRAGSVMARQAVGRLVEVLNNSVRSQSLAVGLMKERSEEKKLHVYCLPCFEVPYWNMRYK